MKKKIFGGIAVFAIATVVAFNINLNAQKGNVSLLALSNVEALASESGRDSTKISKYQYYPAFKEWVCAVPGSSC